VFPPKKDMTWVEGPSVWARSHPARNWPYLLSVPFPADLGEGSSALADGFILWPDLDGPRQRGPTVRRAALTGRVPGAPVVRMQREIITHTVSSQKGATPGGRVCKASSVESRAWLNANNNTSSCRTSSCHLCPFCLRRTPAAVRRGRELRIRACSPLPLLAQADVVARRLCLQDTTLRLRSIDPSVCPIISLFRQDATCPCNESSTLGRLNMPRPPSYSSCAGDSTMAD
jgi:hypothetical protein